jgi:hypothetical protein
MYVVCSKPLQGQYDGCSTSITVGDEVFPIPPDQYGNGFDGGMMPSGTQTFTQQLINDEWHQETLPMSFEDASKAMLKRLDTKQELKINQKESVTHQDGDWAYIILPATMGMVLR